MGGPRWPMLTILFSLSIGAGLVLAVLAQAGAPDQPVPPTSFPQVIAPTRPLPTPTRGDVPTPQLAIVTPAATPTLAPSPSTPSAEASYPAAALASVPQTQRVGGMELTLVISPGIAGYNDISIFFFDPGGARASVETLEFRIQFLEFAAEEVVARTTPLHPGHAYIAGEQLRHSGLWQIEVELNGPQAGGIVASFQLLVP